MHVSRLICMLSSVSIYVVLFVCASEVRSVCMYLVLFVCSAAYACMSCYLCVQEMLRSREVVSFASDVTK
jgi:hypothetical protein